MSSEVAELEKQRLVIQQDLDSQVDTRTRNRMGQFATPTDLALDIQRYAMNYFKQSDVVRFIDPAIGTGSFFSALLDVFTENRIEKAVGYEIDPHYGEPAKELWEQTALDMRLEDFTKAAVPAQAERYNLVICNPPYVRHHYIDNGEKQRLKACTLSACGMNVSGLAGLYCYFLGLSHVWMAEDGLAGWLIPSEFMDVNYGASVKRYLLEQVTLIHVHRFDPNEVQFDDALVSSCVVWFRKRPTRKGETVRFTFGGTLERPKHDRLIPVEALRQDSKWTRYPVKEAYCSTKGPVLGDFFRIKRGVVTGNNKFFILSLTDIKRRRLPIEAFKPVLPGPRYVPDDEIISDSNGNPILENRLFLLDPPWKENEIKERYPNLWRYLEDGKMEGIAECYICRHRSIWYTQEYRPPAPFICTYLGRNDKGKGNPFRFILNNSNAITANVYLMMYPKEPFNSALKENMELKRKVWKYLNGISAEDMLGEGRVYGGGLYKLEPKELANVSAESLIELFPRNYARYLKIRYNLI